MLAKIQFRLNGADLADTSTGAVPHVGDAVDIEHAIDGQRRYRVTQVIHRYTETSVRRVGAVVPAPIIVELAEDK